MGAPLIRLAAAPALVVASLRMAIAAPPMVVAAGALRRGELRALAPADLVLLVLASLALAAHFGFWVAGVQRTSVVDSTAIVATQPLFVGFGAWALLGERPTRELLLGTALARRRARWCSPAPTSATPPRCATTSSPRSTRPSPGPT